MFKYVAITVLILTLCSISWADGILREASDAVTETVELSLLSGTIGWGAGVYWPLYEIEATGTTVGPFVAFGSQMVAAGVGAKFAVEIPMLDNYIDFVAAGGAYHDDDITLELWVGKTIPLK